MKKMIIAILTCLLCCSCFSNPFDDSENTMPNNPEVNWYNENEVVGKWVYKLDYSVIFSFNKNGTIYIYADGILIDTYKWEPTGQNSINIYSKENDSYEFYVYFDDTYKDLSIIPCNKTNNNFRFILSSPLSVDQDDNYLGYSRNGSNLYLVSKKDSSIISVFNSRTYSGYDEFPWVGLCNPKKNNEVYFSCLNHTPRGDRYYGTLSGETLPVYKDSEIYLWTSNPNGKIYYCLSDVFSEQDMKLYEESINITGQKVDSITCKVLDEIDNWSNEQSTINIADWIKGYDVNGIEKDWAADILYSDREAFRLELYSNVNQKIFYTIDGSNPLFSDTAIEYTEPIFVFKDKTWGDVEIQYAGSANTEIQKTTFHLVGPAGGKLIYDKGEYSDGWRYIEFIPESVKIDPNSYEEYFTLGYVVDNETQRIVMLPDTSSEIGMAIENEKVLKSYFDNPCYTPHMNEAFAICDSYTYRGFSDFHIPTINEVNRFYAGSYFEPGVMSSTVTDNKMNRFNGFGYPYQVTLDTPLQLNLVRYF